MKLRGSDRRENRMSGNQRVRQEIVAFLKALDSYPAQFASNPAITFEEHRASLIMMAQAGAQNTRPRTEGSD